MARRHGDYALAGVGAVVVPGGDGVAASVRCGFLSVTETPLVVDLSDAWAAFSKGDEDAVTRAVHAAIDPQDDIHATAEYRRHIAGVLTVRAIQQAFARVQEGVQV
jgi:carbon-monoxide dehydrogenase medium subunit